MEPNWLRQEVANGLSALLVLHLDGAPPAETILQTAEVWELVLRNWAVSWDESKDRTRLSQAFLTLATTCTRWPAPSQLRLAMTARAPAPAPLQLPYPPEKAARNRARLRELIALMGNAWEAKDPNTRREAQAELKKSAQKILDEIEQK